MQLRAGKGGVLKHETDVRIFILFLLNNIRYPLTYDEITELVTADGFVDVFDFATSFSVLAEHGHIISETVEGVEMYMITPKGIETSANLEDALLASIRKRSLQTATRFLSLRRRSATVTATVTPREDGRYTVACRAVAGDGELASFSLTIASAEVAEQIRRHFTEDPEDVIRGLTACATGELGYLLSSFAEGT